MVDTVENLILDLLEWLGRRERTYQETVEAWRTACPRLPVWEDATDRGLVETEHANGRSIVRVAPSGHALLEERRPHSYDNKGLTNRTPRRQVLSLINFVMSIRFRQ
jgi:hypothetical protein